MKNTTESRILLVCLALSTMTAFMVSNAEAQTVNVSFPYAAATEWTDGRTINAGDIRSTRLYCTNGAGELVLAPGKTFTDGEPGADGEFNTGLPTDDTYRCQARHSVTNTSTLDCQTPDPVLGNGVCLSGLSNVVTKAVGNPTLPPPPPPPPAEDFAPQTEPPILEQ